MTELLIGEVLPEPTEGAAQLAHAAHERIKLTMRAMRGLWVELAHDLHQFVRADMWRDLGYDTLGEWLADPAIELERRYVFDLVAMWQELVIERGVDPGRLRELRVSKVREVLPSVRSGHVQLELALADAEQLTRRDLELRYRGVASATPGTPDVAVGINPAAEPAPPPPRAIPLLPRADDCGWCGLRATWTPSQDRPQLGVCPACGALEWSGGPTS